MEYEYNKGNMIKSYYDHKFYDKYYDLPKENNTNLGDILNEDDENDDDLIPISNNKTNKLVDENQDSSIHKIKTNIYR